MQRNPSPPFRCRLAWQVFVLLMPVSLAWLVFGQAITQDGPAHLAAAKIANECMAAAPNVSATYKLQFQPLPNWGAQALGMILLKTTSPLWANRLMNLAGLWLPAIGLAVLAGVAGGPSRKSSWAAACWISLLAMNVTWTFGFTSFLIGLGLGWLVLAQAWAFGSSGGTGRWLLLAVGWPLLFLTHLVAYGIAGLVCGCLVLATPGWPFRRRLAVSLAVAASLPLVWDYRQLSAGAGMELIWEHFEWARLFSLRNWARQLGWIDPISLASRQWVPLLAIQTRWAIVCQSVLWAALVIVVCLTDQLQRRSIGAVIRSEKRGFLLALALLALLGTLGPDSLGREQGHYLPQRIWLGAFSIMACIWPEVQKRGPIMHFCLLAAWALQSAAAVDFGRKAGVYVGSLRQIYASVSPGSTIIALTDARPWAYRANPVLHADALAVLAGHDNTSLNLYEAAYGYFPLQFRVIKPGLEPRRLEQISLMRSPEQAGRRAEEVSQVLDLAQSEADVLLLIADEKSGLRQLVTALMAKQSGWALVESSEEIAIFRRD